MLQRAGYSERGIGVSWIPIAVQVSPIRIRVEPRDSFSTIIEHQKLKFLRP